MPVVEREGCEAEGAEDAPSDYSTVLGKGTPEIIIIIITAILNCSGRPGCGGCRGEESLTWLVH